MVRELGASAAPSSASRGVKIRRTSRVTSGQIDALLSHLETSPYVHRPNLANRRGRKKFDKWWKEVAVELNRLPNGSIKTAEQWITVWRDFKSRAANKLARLRKERVQSSNQPSTTGPLTEVERRIVSVLQNSNYISKPAPIDQKTAPIEQKPAPSVQNPAPIVQKPAPIVQREIPSPNRNLDPSPSVDEQDSSAQQDFLPVAESNAESIRIFADAVKLQAEAAKIQVDTSIMFANAADKIAEAARTQAETSLIIAKTADKIAEALIKISEKLNNN